MLVLALDTATEAVVAAVVRVHADPSEPGAPDRGLDRLDWRVTVRGCDVLARSSGSGPMAHGEQVAVVVQRALATAGIGVGELDLVGVGRGPGPFTGLRVGLVFAESLGWAADLPVHGACTLDVLAAQAQADGHHELLVATDARRREVYWGHYAADGRRLGGPAVSAPFEVPLGRDLPVVGAGGLRYPDAFPKASGPIEPDAAVLARLVAQAALRGDDPDVSPLYLRRPDATPSATRKPVMQR